MIVGLLTSCARLAHRREAGLHRRRFQFAAVNEIGNCAQTLGGYFHQEEGRGDAVVFCAVLIGLGHGGDQFAARAKNLKGTRLRFASDEIEYRVGVLDLIFEPLRMIVHHLVCTKGPHVVDVFVPAVAMERRRARRAS